VLRLVWGAEALADLERIVGYISDGTVLVGNLVLSVRHARRRPGIHDFRAAVVQPEVVDGRAKLGHDD
jgi:hypothetical protein